MVLGICAEQALDVEQVIKTLRPDELTYLCEICALLDELGACSDVWDTDDDDDYEEEEE